MWAMEASDCNKSALEFPVSNRPKLERRQNTIRPFQDCPQDLTNNLRCREKPVILSRPIEVIMPLQDGLRTLPLGLVWNLSVLRPRNLNLTRLPEFALPPAFWILLILLSGGCIGSTQVLAQTGVNDVHITPREVEKPKTEEIAKDNVISPSLNTHVRPLKVAVDLVLVPVTITDPMNRLVTGLEKQNFQLFAGSAAQ